MVLIVGGSNQGKLEYAVRYFGLKKEEIRQDMCSKAKALYGFHNIIRNMLQDYACKMKDMKFEETEVISYIEQTIFQYIDENPDIIILCDEVGCGLVPMEQEERVYREAVGRICCRLAERAEKVHRVICGIGVVIKDA